MSLGPIELLAIKFPNNLIQDEIALALKALVENNTIRIIDILFIKKGESGEVTVREIDELDDVDHSILDPVIADISGLIAEEDIQEIAQELDNNSFAALMLFENRWATAFRDAVLSAKGQLLLNERIPSSAIEQAVAAQATV
jgi:pyridoxal/pyridoxine/pyridoxamine kinase